VKNVINQIFIEIANELNITDSQRGAIRSAYNSVADWLNRNDSELNIYDVKIYSQGSMKLGTVIKPIENDDYDVDLVCQLNEKASSLQAEEVKQLVGNRLKQNQTYKKLLQQPEGKKCWTLNYCDNLNFHMDILPSIPLTTEDRRTYSDINYEFIESIKATNKKGEHNYEFFQTNPHGYAEWFKIRMMQYNQNLFERSAIESIPEYPYKTTLQMVIQLLKRHRDVVFINKQDIAPISIIITTLSAHAYNNEIDIVDAFKGIIDNLDKNIENVLGVKWVKNPVMSKENFANKWEKNLNLENAFYNWLKKVREDFEKLMSLTDLDKVIQKLYLMFTQKTVDRALNNLDGIDKLKSYIREASLPIVYSQKDLEYVPQKKPAPWPLPSWNTVKIKCQLVDNDDKYIGEYSSNSYSIDKNIGLNFYPETSIKKPYIARWQITNTGYEARINQCLRGDFEKSNIENGGRHEDTSYTGSHIVQCFILKNGQCKAKSKEFIVNIK